LVWMHSPYIYIGQSVIHRRVISYVTLNDKNVNELLMF
jgi:hypothetical protein